MLEAFKKLMKTHAELYEVLVTVRKQRALRAPLEELADLAYVCKRMSALADDLRKECDATQRVCEGIACTRWTQESLTDPSRAESIRGKFCTATVDVKQFGSLPHPEREKEDYDKLMDFLKVPKESRRYVHPSFKEIAELVSICATEGRATPPGITKTYPKFGLFLRASRPDLTER